MKLQLDIFPRLKLHISSSVVLMMSPGGDETCQLNVYRTVYGAKLEQHYCLEEDWFIEYFAEGI